MLVGEAVVQGCLDNETTLLQWTEWREGVVQSDSMRCKEGDERAWKMFKRVLWKSK